MSTITPSQPMSACPQPLASPEVYRLSVDEYERMAGLLDDDGVELIDGYLVRKMGKKPPHFWTVESLDDRLKPLLPPDCCTRREGPVRIPDFDEPEPDVAVARGTRADYRTRHPGPADILLIAEVAETTYDRDRGEKWLAYARGGIPIYWIVNLVRRRVEVYTDPGPSGYRSQQYYQAGDVVPVILDGREAGKLAVDDILP